MWDLKSGAKIQDIPISAGTSQASGQPVCMLYAAQYSKEGYGQFIGVAGSGNNEAKVFDHKCGNAVVGIVTGLSKVSFVLY